MRRFFFPVHSEYKLLRYPFILFKNNIKSLDTTGSFFEKHKTKLHKTGGFLLIFKTLYVIENVDTQRH